MAREGMTVMPGAHALPHQRPFAPCGRNAEVPESQAALVRPGARSQARSAGGAGHDVQRHACSAILPEVNAATRTLKARVELANPGSAAGARHVRARCSSWTRGAARKSLLVPTEAVIQTGTRTVVMLAEDDGKFAPVEVEIGIESDGQTEITQGPAGGPAGRRLGAVPDRFRSEPERHRRRG